MVKGIYLDNSTTTQPSPLAVSAMMPYLTDSWGIPSAPHQMGQQLFPTIKENYRKIYQLLDAKEEDQLVITSSGTEAINQVIQSVYQEVTRLTGKNHFITSLIDEAPTIMSFGRLEQYGCVGKMVSPDPNGCIHAQAIADHISSRTALISLSWANGLTGVIHPIAEISKLCKERGILLHVDASHILGKLYFSLEDIQPDFLTFNGDLIHAPKGTGALYFKQQAKVSPLLLGGFEQGGFRAGALNVPLLVALGHAAQEANEQRDLLCTEIARLRDQLETGILSSYPEALPLFRESERLPHCTAIAFPGISNEALLYALNRKNVFATIGGGNFQQLALILIASGIQPQQAHSTISFSLSRYTTEEEIERAIQIITHTAKQLRELSKHVL